MVFRKLVVLASLLALSIGFSASADARDHGDRWDRGGRWDHGRDWDHGRRGRGWHDHGPRTSFSFNVDLWRSGYWHHGWRDGRFGWYWVVGPSYYFYPAPVYPYPDLYRPPTVVVQAPPPPQPTGAPPQQYWYYCPSPEGYYPYIASCREDWRPVPATPPGK